MFPVHCQFHSVELVSSFSYFKVRQLFSDTQSYTTNRFFLFSKNLDLVGSVHVVHQGCFQVVLFNGESVSVCV